MPTDGKICPIQYKCQTVGKVLVSRPDVCNKLILSNIALGEIGCAAVSKCEIIACVKSWWGFSRVKRFCLRYNSQLHSPGEPHGMSSVLKSYQIKNVALFLCLDIYLCVCVCTVFFHNASHDIRGKNITDGLQIIGSFNIQ